MGMGWDSLSIFTQVIIGSTDERLSLHRHPVEQTANDVGEHIYWLSLVKTDKSRIKYIKIYMYFRRRTDIHCLIILSTAPLIVMRRTEIVGDDLRWPTIPYS
jgi:hypothetical protein